MPPLTSFRRLSPAITVGRLFAAPLAALCLLAPAAAQAETRSGVSPVTGMEVRVDGARVTVSASATPSTAFLRSVEGKTVTVACVSGAQDLLEDVMSSRDARPTAPFDAGYLGGPVHWPAGARTVAYDLPRDVSASIDGCVVERSADLATAVGFSPEAQALLTFDAAAPRLALAHRAAKEIARSAPDRRFPASRALAAAIARSEPQMRVAHARTLGAARRNDVVYVISAGTDARRVRLAYRENDGQPTRLVGDRRGPALHLHSPEEQEVPMPAAGEGGRRDPVTG